MRIPVIDDMAWALIKMVALITAYLFTALDKFSPPESINDQIDSISRIYGSFYIAFTPKEELPEIVQQKALSIGRVLLVMVTLAMVWSF